MALVVPVEHHCAATFSVTPNQDSITDADLKEKLAHYASGWDLDNDHAGSADVRWWVDSPSAGLIHFYVASADGQSGMQRAMAVAEGFLAAIEQHAEERRQTPTDAEREISELVSELQERVAKAEAQVDSATASLPAADPRTDRDALVRRWQSLRTDFAATREQLAEAAAGVDRLRSKTEPTHGIVSAEDRRRGLDSAPALQQDLRELEVKLAELKLHLLNVWQQSTGRLEQLLTATDELLRTTSGSDTTRLALNIQAAVQGIVIETEAYRRTLTAFKEVWTNEFTALQRLEVDPASGELLDVYQRVRMLLNDFLFAASQGLSAMRSHLSVLGEQTSDNARHHVLQSNLTRAFQSVQSAHHRFEFAAGGIDTPDNFRLDAALRSSRGLRRRVLEQMQLLEQRLQTEAIDRAAKQRAQALAEAEHAVEQTRATSEQTIEQLFSVQDGLIHAVGLTEDFLHAVLQAELAANRLQSARDDLAKTDRRLADLAALRASANVDPGVELVSCDMIGTQLNLGQRYRLGGIAFAVTLVTVLLGQWWIARRT